MRDTAVCGVLKCDDLAALKSLGSHVRLEAGAPLFREGELARDVYNVTDGALKLSKLLPDGRRQVVAFLLPGDFLRLSQGAEHGLTAEAVTRTTLCRFGRDRFTEFAEAHPHFEREILRLAGHELAAAQAQILLLGRKSARERIASFLLDLEARQAGPKTGKVDLPMSRSDIADHLGLTKETVSRVFADLKTRRLVQLLTPNRLQFLDRTALQALADGYCEA